MLKVLSNILCDLDPKVKVIGQKAGICDGVPSTSALVNFATRLHGIRNGSNSGMKRGGGGGHTLHPHSLGTWDKCPPPPLFEDLFNHF